KIKKRPISLVAHHDALIYLYYSNILSDKYESYISESRNNINNVPTAYRKNRGISNINAAKEIFDFISIQDDCWIIKGDFKGFFDNIRHKILQKNVSAVLNESTLSPDWKSVLKSLTKYRYTNREDINKALKKSHWNKPKDGPYTSNRREIKALIDHYNLNIMGPNQKGIPQGTSLSAILANVYMISFDKIVNEISLTYGGIYRRYSDDFVIVCPRKHLDEKHLHHFIDKIINISNKYTKLEIEKTKTKIFNFNREAKTINKINDNEWKESWFDYLGFVFNGKVVRMRNKSIYKYHYKSKRMLKRIAREENDRKNLKLYGYSRLINKPFIRKSWENNELVWKKLSPYKTRLVKNRLWKANKILNSNIPQRKLSTRMFLVSKRYGDKYSMAGYARRAQKILSNNNHMYKVEVFKQINSQIIHNQKYFRNLRKGYK
ncbi:reverse transcriptase/maturase family protein, partial [Lactobacillus sp. Sy-1]|uniref:reverse transcriptase/maturase family protein n=1 Tax=Lactobacillus sp. Sy-1 TaxID=2109645 RepID=UPI001C5B0AFF